jgi:dihydropteroate synthase
LSESGDCALNRPLLGWVDRSGLGPSVPYTISEWSGGLSDNLYLRPLGLLWGAAAGEARVQGEAFPLAGGPAAFLAVEIIEGVPGKATRRISAASGIAASGEPALQAAMARLTAPRPAVAGVAMDGPRIMGIVNVTPDSFSDGGDFYDAKAAAAQARRLASEGADFIDIGGESTRPGAADPGDEEELARIRPVLAVLQDLPVAISVDTRKASVMRAAGALGAGLINDVSGLTHDPEAQAAAVELHLPVVLMHMKGAPSTMQDNPIYADVLLEVYDYLRARIAAVEAAGIPRDLIVADPGIGFGKTAAHNLALLSGLSLFHGLGVPILVGVSRKRFVGSITGEGDPKRRLAGSVGAALAAVGQGVQMVRVHDVLETRQSIHSWRAAVEGRWPL